MDKRKSFTVYGEAFMREMLVPVLGVRVFLLAGKPFVI